MKVKKSALHPFFFAQEATSGSGNSRDKVSSEKQGGTCTKVKVKVVWRDAEVRWGHHQQQQNPESYKGAQESERDEVLRPEGC